tara:strand:- start:6983 stop:7813 length:831 start_codon:yes stop_codon:yes gene_type:complete
MVSLPSFLKSTVERVAGLSAAARIPMELVNSSALILLILLIGMALILSRELIILLAPWIARNSVGIAKAINVIFTLLFDVITVIIDIIITIIKVVDLIRKVVPGCHHASHPPAYKKLGVYTPVSAEGIRRFWSDLPNRCHPYNKVGYILSKATKRQTNELLCPVVRASYPVDWMWETSNTLLGWAIVDATPQGVHTLTGEPPGNCRAELHAPAWECVGLGIGYLVVDVLLPILLLSIIWPYLITPVLKLLYGLTFDTLGLLGSYLLPSRKPKQKKQ